MISDDRIAKYFEARDRAQQAIREIDNDKAAYFVTRGDQPPQDITAQHRADLSEIADLLDEVATAADRRRSPRH